MKQIDMSSKAITRRLKMASELRDLSLSLMKAKRRTEEEAAELRKELRERRPAENDPPTNLTE